MPVGSSAPTSWPRSPPHPEPPMGGWVCSLGLGREGVTLGLMLSPGSRACENNPTHSTGGVPQKFGSFYLKHL